MKRVLWICILIGMALTPVTLFAQDSAQEVMAHFRNEPTIEETMAAALRNAGLDSERFDSMNSRAAGAYALPKVLSYEFTYRDQDRNRPQDVYTFKDGDTEKWTERKTTKYQEDTDYMNHKVRAQWDLSKLVYNSDQMRVTSLMNSSVDKRDKLLKQVTKVYYERRKLQINMLTAPQTSVAKQLDEMLEMERLTATLNALTGGRFSRNIGK